MKTTRHYPVTEEPETMDEAYERIRFEALPETMQRLVVLHLSDQYDAVPSYAEHQAHRFLTEQE